MKHKITILLIVIALLAAALACTGDGDGPTVAPTDPPAACSARVYAECMAISNPDTCVEMARVTCED